MGQDHLIWRTTYPTNPFAQQGTPNNPVVYWLADGRLTPAIRLENGYQSLE